MFFFTNSAFKPQHVLFVNEPFLGKMLALHFSCNILLYIQKKPVEKLSKVLQMELETYTPLGSRFLFKKIKFKILHNIQHGFLRQRQVLIKDQNNFHYFDHRFKKKHSNKRRQIFFLHKSRCGKCSLEIE